MSGDLATWGLTALGAIAGLPWLALLWRKTGPLGLSLLTLFVAICFGYDFWHSRGTFPVTLDRLCWGMLLVGLLLSASRDGGYRFAQTRADRFVLLFLGYLVVAAGIPYLESRDTAGPSRWLFFYAFPGTLYFAARYARLTPAAEKAVFGLLAVLGLYLALTGVAEVGVWSALIFPHYIATTQASAEFFGRARGPLLNPVVNGYLMTLSWVAWTKLGLDMPGKFRWIVPIGHILLPVGLFCTLTRSVWLSAAVGLVLAGVWLLPPSYRRAWVATGVFGLMLGAVILRGYFWEMKRDRDLSAAEAARSVQLRPLLAAVAWRMVQDRPVLGFGLAQYDRAKRPYLEDPTAGLPLRQTRPYTQHNVFLSLLVETGVVGLMLGLFLLAAWSDTAWRLRNTRASSLGLLAAVALSGYVVNGLFHDVSIIPGMNAVLFFVAGLAESARLQPLCDACQTSEFAHFS